MVVNVEKYLKKAHKLNKEFFGFDLDIEIKLIKKRAEFDKLLGEKTPKWVCGAYNGRTIIIFDPYVYEKETIHKLSSYEKTIVHEMNHIFYKEIMGSSKPWWFSEGLTLNIEGNYKTKLKEIDFNSLLYTWTFDISKNFYPNSYLAVKKLIQKLGKNKLLNIIIKNSKNPKKINRLFKEKLK